MPSIPEYFAGKSVLVTGATGLVGRVLAEKLLRDLSDVRRLYLIIRPRTGRIGKVLSVEERLDADFLGSSVFDALRESLGDDFLPLAAEKFVAVEGDLGLERLGMDDETYQRLQDEVELIINCAAAVTFDAPLDVALNLNALGPLRLLEFARGCRNPVLFAHVSTCYVNGARQGLVEEEPLDPTQTVSAANDPYDVDQEVAALQGLVAKVEGQSHQRWRRLASRWAARRQRGRRGNGGGANADSLQEQMRRQWVERRLSVVGMRWARSRGWNDTYTFTKAMGEQLVVRHKGAVQTLILRPAIVESALETPVPGWLDGMRMVDPLIVAYGRNQLPDFPGTPGATLDLIPVDMVVNALLAAIPRAHQGDGPLVYQVASGTENPITVGDFADLVQDYFANNSLTGRGAPGGLPRLTWPSPERFMRRLRYRYLLPIKALEALCLGILWSPLGRRLRSNLRSRRAGLERLVYYATILRPYSTVQCQYLSQHTRQLWDGLGPEDQERFNFDVNVIDWSHYVQEVHIPGLKRFVLGIDRPVRSEAPDNGDGPLSSKGASGQGDGGALRGRRDGPGRSYMGSSAQGKQTVEFWMGSSRLNAMARWFTRWLFGLGFRHYLGFTWEGLEHVPASGAFIAVSNHNSHVDTAALMVLLGKGGRPVHPVAAKDYFFNSRLRSWASRTFLGAIPFDRQSPAAESLGLAIELLRRGHSLIFFPEGGRSQNGKLRPFKRGVGMLALESGAPLLPVRIEGSFRVLPKGGFFLKRHAVHVRIGPPISVDSYDPGDTGSPQEAIRRLSEDAHRAVEALS